MLKQLLKFLRSLLTAIAVLGLAALIVPRAFTTIAGLPRTFSVGDAPNERAAIVFGVADEQDLHGCHAPVTQTAPKYSISEPEMATAAGASWPATTSAATIATDESATLPSLGENGETP